MKIISILAIALMLMGCKEVRQARANRIYHETRRANEVHAQDMAERQAIANDVTTAKISMLYVGTGSFAVLAVVMVLSWTYYLYGTVTAAVERKRIFEIPDPSGRRYPVLIKGNTIVVLATGQRYQLESPTDREPHPMLVGSSTRIANCNSKRPSLTNKVVDGLLLGKGG